MSEDGFEGSQSFLVHLESASVGAEKAHDLGADFANLSLHRRA